ETDTTRLLLLAALGPDAVQVIDAAQEQSAAGDRGGRPEHLVEGVLAEHLELRPGLEDVRRAAVVQAEDLAIAGPRRGPEGRGARQPLAIHLLAGAGVVTGDKAPLAQDVEVALINER